jgi:hypothetical protein
MTPEKNVGGRPREHNREQVGLDMIEWAKLPGSINLNKFCAYYEPIIPPSKISQWAKEDDGFRRAYEAAKTFIGFRREEMLNKDELHVKAYDLNATVYDQFLKDEKRQQQEFENSLAKESNTSVPEAIAMHSQAMIDIVTNAQSDRSKERIKSKPVT